MELEAATTAATETFIDLDTDGDGVGNKQDLDDDGDSIPDIIDSSPLVAAKNSSETAGEGNAKANDDGGQTSNIPQNVQAAVTEGARQVAEVAAASVPQVAAVAETIFEKVEEFRMVQAEQIKSALSRAEERVKQEAAKKSTEENEEMSVSPWPAQTTVAALSVAAFAFDNRFLFYPILFVLLGYLLIYKLGGFLIRKIFGQ